MRTKIKDRFYQMFYSHRRLILISYALILFISIQDKSSYGIYDINIFDYMILMYADHYNIMFFILPLIFLIITREIREIKNIELIRYKNAYEFCFKQIKKFAGFTLIYVSGLNLIRFIVGLGRFPIRTIINSVDYNDYFNEVMEMFNLYANNFNNGLVVIILITIYLVWGLIFLYSLLTMINQKYSYKTMVLFAVGIFIIAYIGFKKQINVMTQIVSLSNYLLLHQGLFRNNRLVFTLLVMIATFTIFYSFMKSKITEEK